MSRAITSLSKQQASVIPDNEGGSKAKVLRQMIEQLEKEKKEYLKTNQYLVQSTQQVCQENQTLKEEINNRKAYYEHILDRNSQSAKTLETEIDNNKKMSKIYHGYKNKVSSIQKTNPDPAYCSEMEKYEQELNDIEKSANDLLKRYYESEKKVYDYQVLLSLDTRLNGINHVFTKEAQNCISANDSNPKLFSSSRLTRLQKRMSKGDEIKKDLSIEDGQIETEKLSTAKNTVDNISNELDRFLPIYNHITLINRQRMLMSEEEDLDYKTPASSRATSKPSSPRHSSRSNGKDEPSYGSAVSKVPQTVTWSDEISELRRIVGTDGFSYLNDSDRERQLRRIQGYFLPGKRPDDYPSYEESDESNKKGTSENDNRPPLSVKELEKLIAQPIKSDNSEKRQTSDNLDKDNNKSDNLNKDNNKSDNLNKDNNESEKLQKSDKNKSDNEKNEPLVTAKELEEIFNQPEEDPDNTKLSENGDDLDKSNKSEHSEKVKNSDKPNQSENGDQEDKSPKPSIFESLIRQGVQTDGCVKSNEAADKISKSVQTDPPQLHVDPLRSLLVHPEKGKKQPGESNGLKNAEEEEHASEFILDKSDELPDEKDKRDQVSNPQKSEESTKSKQPEEPAQKPVDPSVSLLVHPTKDRQKLGTNQDQKNAEEEEHASEFILDKSEGHQEEEAHHSEKSVHSHKSEQSNKSKPEDKTEPPKLTVDPLISLLVHPTKDRQKPSTSQDQKNAEEEDRASEFILEQSEKTINSEASSNTPKSEKVSNSAQTEPIDWPMQQKPVKPQKPADEHPYSLLVHPTKIRRKSSGRHSQRHVEEEDAASECQLYLSETQSEVSAKVDQPLIPPQTEEVVVPKKTEVVKPVQKKPQKPADEHPYSLLVHPTRVPQKPNYHRRVEEEETASEYLLLDQSETQSEITSKVDQPVKPTQSVQATLPVKTETVKKPPKPADEHPNSLLVHPTKDRQQPTNYYKESTEEDNASEYMLDQSETQSEITNKVEHTVKSTQTEVARPEKTETVKRPQKPSGNPNSLLVHPTKDRQQTTKYGKENCEEDAASEYLLDQSEAQSEITSKVEQLVKPPQAEQVTKPKKTETAKPPQKPSGNPNSLLVRPTKGRQPTTKYGKSNTEEDLASEYLLDQSEAQSEITSKVEQLVKHPQAEQVTKPKKTETVKPPKKPSGNPNSLLVRPTKDRQQITKHNSCTAEEDLASEYLFDKIDEDSEIVAKKEKPVYTQHPSTVPKVEPAKPKPQAPVNHSVSLLVRPTNERRFSDIPYKDATDEELLSEYLLEESETPPSKPRKKEAEHVDAQTSTKLPDVRSPETSKSSKTSPKVTKPVHQSTYDPSIFYTNSLSPTKPAKVVPLCTDKVPITVSLKDIGLEGLDSSTPGKTQELKMLQQLREEERKAKSRRGRNGSKYEYKRDEKLDPLSQGEVVCKLTSFEPSSSTRRSKMNSSKKKVASMTPYISLSYDERHESSGTCPKQASLLDSTHNAQKSQAIKPKAQQKSAPKVNMSNSGGFGENDLNGQVNRSPRRYNTAANDPGELQDLAGRLSAAVILDNVVE